MKLTALIPMLPVKSIAASATMIGNGRGWSLMIAR